MKVISLYCFTMVAAQWPGYLFHRSSRIHHRCWRWIKREASWAHKLSKNSVKKRLIFRYDTFSSTSEDHDIEKHRSLLILIQRLSTSSANRKWKERWKLWFIDRRTMFPSERVSTDSLIFVGKQMAGSAFFRFLLTDAEGMANWMQK